VVVEEPLRQVVPYALPERLAHEGEVLVQLVRTEGQGQEGPEPDVGVVLEPVIAEDRDDVVSVRCEGRLRDPGQIVLKRVPLVGEDQARRVEAVSAEHAADRVGDEFLHGPLPQPRLAGLVGQVPLDRVGRVAGEGDLLDRDLRGQLVLEPVGVDEDPVVLLLETLHLRRHAGPVGAEVGVGGLERAGPVVRGEKGESGEVPGGLVGVPV